MKKLLSACWYKQRPQRYLKIVVRIVPKIVATKIQRADVF